MPTVRLDSETAKAVVEMFENAQHAKDLSDEDPLLEKANFLGDGFTQVVASLRTLVDNENINRLGTLLWGLVGHKIVPVAIGPKVTTVSFLAFKYKDLSQAQIILPLDWGEMFHKDPIYQAGAVVGVGSKAIDFYNNQFNDEAIEKRARLWEAEFLLTVLKGDPSYSLDSYQRSVVSEFPEGLRSNKAVPLLYSWKPFTAPN